MKKILCFVLTLIFLVNLVPVYAAEPEEIPINEENFPDEIFRGTITEKFDKNTDGKLDKAEASEVTRIDVSNKVVTDLTGLKYFSELQELFCSNNQLTGLDVSKNTKLTNLYCDQNKLTALNLKNNTKLKVLSCNDNQLKTLDLSTNGNLHGLMCQNSQLEEVTFCQNPSIGSMYLDDNHLSSLNLEGNHLNEGEKLEIRWFPSRFRLDR